MFSRPACLHTIILAGAMEISMIRMTPLLLSVGLFFSSISASAESLDSLDQRRTVISLGTNFFVTCLDVPKGHGEDDVVVQLWKCANQPNQSWERIPVEGERFLLIFQNVESRKCLDVLNSSKDLGANIVQRTCDINSLSQQWYIAGEGYPNKPIWLVNRNSGLCIQSPVYYHGNGRLPYQWRCTQLVNKDAADWWRLSL
jgi:hypothetical protein